MQCLEQPSCPPGLEPKSKPPRYVRSPLLALRVAELPETAAERSARANRTGPRFSVLNKCNVFLGRLSSVGDRTLLDAVSSSPSSCLGPALRVCRVLGTSQALSTGPGVCCKTPTVWHRFETMDAAIPLDTLGSRTRLCHQEHPVGAEPQHLLQCNQAEGPVWCQLSPVLRSIPALGVSWHVPSCLQSTSCSLVGCDIENDRTSGEARAVWLKRQIHLTIS